MALSHNSESAKNFLPTPLYPDKIDSSVYPPSEDSFLLIDAIEKELPMLIASSPRFCMEIGCGSGVIINFFRSYVSSCSQCFAVDINRKALETSTETSILNKNSIEFIQCDLLSPFSRRLHHSIDVLLFNPPYVPTDTEEMEGSQVGCGGTESIYSTWAGGLDGMEITWKVLNLLDDYLSEQGVAYIVFLADNNPKSVREEMKKRGFTSKIVKKRGAGIELLYIIKFQRVPKAD